MIECLNDLSNYLKDNNGKLMLFYGKTEIKKERLYESYIKFTL